MCQKWTEQTDRRQLNEGGKFTAQVRGNWDKKGAMWVKDGVKR